jgi:hypothetical protein
MSVLKKIHLGKFIRIYFETFFTAIFMYLLYAHIFHEFLHFAVCILSGNEGKIIFGLPSKVECVGMQNSAVFSYWLYDMAPYLLLALPVSIIFSSVSLSAKNYRFRLVLIILPWIALLDSLINFFGFFIPSNDFHNLLAVNPMLFVLGVFLILIITFISKFWIERQYLLLRKAVADKKRKNNVQPMIILC